MRHGSSDYKLLTKLYFHLLPYQALMLVINAANGIVDSLYASNFVGQTAMSAIGFYVPFTHFLFAVSIMLVSGSQLKVGEAMGRNQKDKVQKLFSTDLVFAAGIAILTAAALALLAVTDITRMFVTDPTERHAMNLYILGQSVGVPALILGQQLFSFLSMENKRKRTTLASIVCIIVNTLMNTLLVIILKMGTLGLGLGSSAGLWGFFLTMALFYFSGKSEMKFSLSRFDWKESLKIVRLGYTGALSRFVEMFRCIIVNILILRYVGSVGLSAFAAVNSVMAVFWPVPFGMVAVTRMLLGISIGEEDRKSVTDIMRIVYIRCLLFQCAISLLIVLLATPFTRMFYRDLADPVYNITKAGFRLMPLCMPLAIISLNMVCYVQATKKKFLSLVLPIVDGAVGVVLCSLILIPLMKMNGLYLSNILNGVICLALVVGYSVSCLKRFPKNMEELLVLPDDLGAADDARMDIEVLRMPEVMEVSKQVTDFCRRRGVDSRRAYFAGLALEEMAGNVVQHGFTKDNKKHAVDIRVVQKDDDIILRFRDNCTAFNPLERMNVMDSDDQIKNIGIRLVNGIAKDVQYQNLLGMNVLTIRI